MSPNLDWGTLYWSLSLLVHSYHLCHSFQSDLIMVLLLYLVWGCLFIIYRRKLELLALRFAPSPPRPQPPCTSCVPLSATCSILPLLVSNPMPSAPMDPSILSSFWGCLPDPTGKVKYYQDYAHCTPNPLLLTSPTELEQLILESE